MPRPNGAMGSDLQLVVASVADLSDAELLALTATMLNAPQIAPGLRAWISGVCA